MSGIAVADDVKTRFDELKLKKKYGYLIFDIVDNKIQCIKEGEIGCTFDDFRTEVIGNGKEPKYAVFDLKDGIQESVMFIAWIPDEAPVKKKMVYASSKDSVLKVCTGLKGSVNINDISDFTEEELREKKNRK